MTILCECGGETEVEETRKNKKRNRIWRRRRCLKCNKRLSTYELTANDIKDARWAAHEFMDSLKEFINVLPLENNRWNK